MFVKIPVVFASQEAVDLQELGINVDGEDPGEAWINPDQIIYLNEVGDRVNINFSHGGYLVYDGSIERLLTYFDNK